MKALARIIGTIGGAVPFALAVGLERSAGWGLGTGVWGLLILILVWSPKGLNDEEKG